MTFERSHDLDSRDRMVAGRLWAATGSDDTPWRGKLSVSRLHSKSRNFFAGDEINRTSGGRTSISVQAEHRFTTGAAKHLLVVAGETEREQFAAGDTVYFGATSQKQRRAHDSLTAQWRGAVGPLTLDLAARHDRFSRFRDSTSLRGSALIELSQSLSLAASYGEGIAQPTFFDLFGFFPGSFVGNPSLRPESSKGFEVSLRGRGKAWNAALTAFRQRLTDEIVETFDFDDLPGLDGQCRRREPALGDRSGRQLGAEPGASANGALRIRRFDPAGRAPRAICARFAGRGIAARSRSMAGADGCSYGASLAYTGARADNNFEVPPFGRVRLEPYWLAGARVAYAVRPGVELFGRVANAFDDRYQDVFAYRTEGRSLHAGIRLADRR